MASSGSSATAILNVDGVIAWASPDWTEGRLGKTLGVDGQSVRDVWPQPWLAKLDEFVANGGDEGTLVLESVQGRSGERMQVFRISLGGDQEHYLLQGGVTLKRSERQPQRTSDDSTDRGLAVSSPVLDDGGLDRAGVYNLVAGHVAEMLGDVCLIRIPDQTGTTLEIEGFAASPGLEHMRNLTPLQEPSLLKDGVTGHVFRTGNTLRVQLTDIPDDLDKQTRDLLASLGDAGVHSAMVMPLVGYRGLLGTIGVLRVHKQRAYTAEDETFLGDLANLAGMALEGAEFEHELRLAADEQERITLQLRAIADAVVDTARSQNTERALEVVTRHAREIIGAHQALTSLTVGNDWAQAIQTVDLSDKYAEWREYDVQPEGNEIYRLVCEENKPFRLTQQELDEHPAWLGFGEEAGRHPPMRGWLAAPLVDSSGRNIGLIRLSDRYEGEFTETDEAILVQFAQVASAVIDNARLYDHIQLTIGHVEDQAQRLQILNEITRVLVSAPMDPERIARRAASQIGRQVGDTCVIRLLSDDDEWLPAVGIYHPDADVQERLRSLLAEVPHGPADGLAGAALQAQQTRLIRELDQSRVLDYIDPKYQEYLELSQIHSSLVTPLVARGRIIGTLSLSRVTPGYAYSQADVGLIESVAGLTALAIDNAQLYVDESRSRSVAQEALTERDAALSELEALNDELEERVRDRTNQLEAINSELEAFAYSVTHDLRAPLRAIDGFSLAVVEDFADDLPERARRYLERVRAASQRMDQIIDDLLRLSRVSQAELHLENVDVSAIARETAGELLRDNDRRENVTVDIEDGLTARADARLLRHVILNLLDNALKFSAIREDSTIRVGRDTERSDNVLFVSDDGAGFDPSYADKLFRPFQRLHTLDEFEGTGIGLAIVQRIVTRHGGSIWAISETDQGATFYFTLTPVSPEDVEGGGYDGTARV